MFKKATAWAFGAPSRLLEKQIKIVDVYCANVLEREWTWKLSDASREKRKAIKMICSKWISRLCVD